MDPGTELASLRNSLIRTRSNYNSRIARANTLNNLNGNLKGFAPPKTLRAKVSGFFGFGKKNTTRINAAKNSYRRTLTANKQTNITQIQARIDALEKQQRIWEEFQNTYGLERALARGHVLEYPDQLVTSDLMTRYEALGYELVLEKPAYDYPGPRGPIPMPASYPHYVQHGNEPIPMTKWASTIDSLEGKLKAQRNAHRKQAEWDAAKPGLIARYQALGYTYVPAVKATYDSGYDGHGSYSILTDPGKPEHLTYKLETQMAVSGNGWRIIEKKVGAYTRKWKVNVGRNQDREILEERSENIPAGTTAVYVRDLPAGFPAVINSYDFATKIDELEALRGSNAARRNANRRNANGRNATTE